MKAFSCFCVLCHRKKFTPFPVGHIRVLSKQSAMPDSKDMSLDQISSEPTLCGHTL